MPRALLQWDYLSPAEISKYQQPDGLLDEFKMMWELRYRFPLHYIVFKQVSSHLPHEANVEEYFSRAGKISDPNMAPVLLGKLVMVGVNKKRFWPTVQAIKERYYLKYRGGAGSSADYEE